MPKKKAARKTARRRSPARSTAIARRPKSNPAVKAARNKVATLEGKLKAAQKRTRKVKADYQAQTMPVAMLNGGLVLAGGAGNGLIKGLTGMNYLGPLAIELPLAGAAIAGAMYFQRPEPLFLAAGILAPLVSEAVDELVTDVKAGDKLAIPQTIYNPTTTAQAAQAQPDALAAVND